MAKTNKCIIVGNGPSIKNIPLERLSYPTFGLNNMKPGFRPTHYVNLRREHVFRMEAGRDDWRHDVGVLRDGVARCKERSFIWRGNVPLAIGDEKTTYMATERIMMWSDSMDYAFVHHSQTHCAAQIAVMLGFTEIIMIGMDNNRVPWEGKDPNHYRDDYFGEHLSGMSKRKVDLSNMWHAEMHEFVERECAKRGVRVRNEDTRHYIS